MTQQKPASFSFFGSHPGTMSDRAQTLVHVVRSMRTTPLTAVAAHSGIAFIIVAMGHPFWAGLVLVASVCAERLITAFSYAAERNAYTATDRVAAHLAGVALLRSIMSASVLAGMMHLGGEAGALFSVALGALIAAIFIIQFALVPVVMVLAVVPMLAVLALSAFTLHEFIAPIAVWLTFANVVATLVWLAKYVARAQTRTLRLIAKAEAAAAANAKAMEMTQADARVREELERACGLGFYNIDFRTSKARWSPGAFKVYGREETPDTPSLNDILAQIQDDCGPRMAKDYLRAIKTCQPIVQSYPILGQDGVRRDVRAIAVPFANDDGEVIRLAGVVMDETEQMQLIRNSEAVERRLRAALSVGSSAVWEYDVVRGESFALGAVRHLLGREEMDNDVLQVIVDRINPDDVPAVMASMKTSAKTGVPTAIEHRYQIEGRGEGWVRTILDAQFRSDGPGYGLITALTTDITDEVTRRHTLADALHAAEAGSRAKSSFLANMSHEIRTPLHGVLAVTDMLAKTELSDDQRAMLDLVQSSGAALSAVVNDVLDLARVESGRLEITPQPVALADVINASTQLFQAKANEKAIALDVHANLEPGLVVEADPVRLGQIISNLVSNAVKFTQTGGVDVRVDCQSQGKVAGDCVAVTLTVSDTGPGIPADRIDNLFNRFEQLDSSITREHGGSGLGLAIVQSLAELMGSKVEAKSVVGEGSCFSLTLDLPFVARACDQQVETEAPSQLEPGRLRILAADDHPTNRQVIALVLGQLDVDLTLVENGAEAVAAYKASHFDVVLMDLQMPVMDGLTAMREIRAFEQAHGKPRVAIAAVTANAMAHHRDEACAAGADLHIAKPYTPDQLVNGINALLNQAALEDEDYEGLSQTG